MDDFFRKVNVLVRAGLNDLLGDEGAGRQPAGALRPDKLGKDVDREIAALRERINQALDYEDKLQARLGALQAEAARWNEQIDTFIQQGRDDSARHAAGQFQFTQQRLAMAESDLREHQLVTQELILRVNELDAAVADARQREAAASGPDAAPAAPGEAAAQSASRLVSDVLRDMREKMAELGEMVSAQGAPSDQAAAPDAASANTVDSQSVDDDLAQRRDRLSKK
jgi:phage shock protein A